MPLNQVQPQLLPQTSNSTASGAVITQPAGPHGDSWVSEIHGKWWTAARNGNVWHASVSGVTLPLNAAALVSVFSLYNPVGSGFVSELISADIGTVLATTVVDEVNLYAELNAVAPTLTTLGTPVNGLLGQGRSAPQGAKFYSALTHTSGVTPTRVCSIANYGAVTTTNEGVVRYDFDGKVIIYPGSIVSIAMSTATSTASGMAVAMSWADWPM